jgi:hypothetical protein
LATSIFIGLFVAAGAAIVLVRAWRRRKARQAPLVVPDPVGAVRLLRVVPEPSGRTGALIVTLEWGRVAPGDVLLLPFFDYRDVVAPKAVVRVEPLPAVDDAFLLRVWVEEACRLELETWADKTLPLDTVVEVFDRAPAT